MVRLTRPIVIVALLVVSIGISSLATQLDAAPIGISLLAAPLDAAPIGISSLATQLDAAPIGISLLAAPLDAAPIGISLLAAPLDVERLSSVKESVAGALVTHTFSIRNNDSTSVDIEISVELPRGWRELGVPASMTIGPEEESFVFLTVSVPAAALAGGYEPALIVQQVDSVPGSTHEPIRASAPVNVLPIAELLLESSPLTILPGDAATADITITNLGNVQEQVELLLSSPSGVRIEGIPGVVTLSPREDLTVEFVVRVDASVDSGRLLIPIVAQSTIHPGVAVQGFVDIRVLPPGPSRVPSTIATILPITVGIESGQGFPLPDNPEPPQTSLSLSCDKQLSGNELTFRLRLKSLFGPQPLSISSFLVGYEALPVSMKIGDISTSLTGLLSATVTGARLSFAFPLITALAVVGVEPATATAGAAAAFGPEHLRAGVAYLEERTELSQASSVSVFVRGTGSFPEQDARQHTTEETDWSIEWEAALAQADAKTSWGTIGSIRCDITESFVELAGFRIGGAFPFGVSDRVGYELNQRYRSDALSLGTSYIHERSNVEHDPSLVTTLTDRLGLTLDLLFSDDLPTVTAVADLQRLRTIDPVEDHLRSSYAVSVAQPETPVPFRSFVQWTDRWDRTFDHRLHEWDVVQELGVVIAPWLITAVAAFETVVSPQTGDRLGGMSRISLLVESEDSPLSGTLLGTASQDERDLTLSLRFAPKETVDLLFDVGLTWNRNDEPAPELSLGLKATALIDLPVPFALDSGQIEGRVFVDINGNGVYDAALPGGRGDAPLEAMILSIGDGRQQVSSDRSGRFRFAALPPQRYQISVSEPPQDVVLDEPIDIDLAAGERRFVDVPLRPSLRISGSVLKNEGTSDDQAPEISTTAGEQGTGVPGVRLTLTSNDGGVLETRSSPSGGYAFSHLAPGGYVVAVDPASLPERFELTSPGSASVSLATASVPGVDFHGWIRPRQLVITFQPPFADFTASPDPASTADTIVLDGSWSLDFDGEIVAYEWDWDGDGNPDATGEAVKHRFPSPGEYPVTLTVIDNDGATDSVTLTVNVE